MLQRRRSHAFARLLVVALGATACDPPAVPPGPGAISVTATATTPEPTIFQFGVSIDSSTPRTATVGQLLNFVQTGMAHGKHVVTVTGVPQNCAGIAARDLTLFGDDTVHVPIAITCPRVTGDIGAIVTTTGQDLDPNGYLVNVNNVPRAQIGINAAAVVPFLPAGNHVVTLTDVASNCTVIPATRTVAVAAGTAPTASFAVSCAPVGVLKFVGGPTGQDRDPDGYTLRIDSGATTILSSTATTNVRVVVGTHSYVIGDVQPNCTIPDGNTGSKTLAAGDTITISLAATCATIPMGTVGWSAVDPVNDTITSTFSGTTTPHDVIGVTGRYTADWLILVVRFSRPITSNVGANNQGLFGLIDFDTDEVSQTGFTSSVNSFGGTATMGADFTLQFSSDSVSARLFRNTGASVILNQRVRTRYEGDSVIVQIPLAKFLNDDGNAKVAMVLGPQDRPTDIVPNTSVLLARVPGSPIVAPPPPSLPRRILAPAVGKWWEKR